MIPTKAKLSIFLLLGLGAAIYLWWRFSDEQVVLRRTDAFFESATVQRISLGDSNDALDLFRSVISDPVSFSGDDPIPTDTIPREDAVELLKTFRESVGSCKIRRLSTKVAFPTPDQAQVEAVVESHVSWGRGSPRLDKFKAELLFERTPEGWMLTKAAFLRRDGK